MQLRNAVAEKLYFKRACSPQQKIKSRSINLNSILLSRVLMKSSMLTGFFFKCLIFLLVLKSTFSCGKKCPKFFKRIGHECYHFGNIDSTFQSAVERCRGIGGKLAEPADEFESQLLAKKFPGNFYWIGIDDRRHENKYVLTCVY